MNPLVTIAIPIYNAEDYLRFAIQSVINQTYNNWELLLMEDGSTDSSLDICKEFELSDNRIKVVSDGSNRGLIFRLNQSVDLANGLFYARMDADDIMYITRIESQVQYLLCNSRVDVLGTSIMTINSKNSIIGSGYEHGEVTDFTHPTVMGKIEWFRAHRYESWALRAEDTELWQRTVSNSNFYAIEKPLLFYREFGVPTFKKYSLSQITIIKIALRYKNYNKSLLWCFKKMLASFVKIFLCAIFAMFGRLDVMINMRKREPIPEPMQLTSEDLLCSIKGA